MMSFLSVVLDYSLAVGLSKGLAAIGASIVVLAAAMGIGKIGANAMDAIARQPQASGDIRSSMILAAALIEGVAFIAIIVCLLSYFVQLG